MGQRAESDGNGKVYVGGKTLDFPTYVVLTLEDLKARTGRLEKAAMVVMGIICLAVLGALLASIGLSKP